MKLAVVALGALCGLPLAACAGASGAHPTPPGASVAAGVTSDRHRPAMDGTCSITEGPEVLTFTYEQGRLTHSTATDVETTYTYEGERLVGVGRWIGGALRFRSEFRYDAADQLVTVATFSRGLFSSSETIEETERRTLEYRYGRLVRVSEAAIGAEPWRVCELEYDDWQRLAACTCDIALREGGPQRLSYHYDAAGRVSEMRSDGHRSRTRYDASGLPQLYERLGDTGQVESSTTTVRDAEGHALERRTTSRNEPLRVEVFSFDGTFDPGAECGCSPPPPPGVPEDALGIWFAIHP